MNPASHQTIKLSKGKHSSPQHGACVMELASMLAGEPFTDHPHAVSGPIGAFLRGYNDLIDDDRRQDLYALAARAVGTAASDEVEERRAEMLIRWGDERWDERIPARFLGRLRRPRVKRQRLRDLEAAGSYAVHAISRVSDRMHARVLDFIDELIALGNEPLEHDRSRAQAATPEPVST